MSQDAFSLLHSGVQRAIYEMGWKEIREVQQEAIRTVYQTDNHLLVCAQTAGGKTEAAFLPVISKLADAPKDSVQAIYVGPLKALINDQFRRLEDLCEHLEIPVHRWHGDVPGNQKKRLRENPGGILLITPESLESNFVNFGADVPRVYRHVSFVVIDEMHSFLGNERGIHLRSLLARLGAITETKPRIIGLSATLAEPEEAAIYIDPDAPDTVTALEAASAQREVKFGVKTYLESPSWKPGPPPGPEALQALAETLAAGFRAGDFDWKQEQGEILDSDYADERETGNDSTTLLATDLIKAFGKETNLIFGDSKALLESLLNNVNQQTTSASGAHAFVIHHGSLSRSQREEIETRLKSGQPTTAFCSSTLEMGIDIGNVRAVGQINPPWTVASMVQRLGRSGRRAGVPAIMRVFTQENTPSTRAGLSGLLYPNILRAVALTRLMVRKWVEPFDNRQLHLSTMVQQLMSCLKQTGGMQAGALFETLCSKGPFRNIDAGLFATTLRSLGEKEIIEQMPGGDLILALEGERLANELDFYAAFMGSEEWTLRHRNEDLGQLPSSAIPPVGGGLMLGGRSWRVEEIVENSQLVYVIPGKGKDAAPAFRGQGSEVHSRVVREMKTVLEDDDEPAFLDEAGRGLLAAARTFARESGLLDDGCLCGGGEIIWFPWRGTRCLTTLKLMADACDIKAADDALSIRFKAKSTEDLQALLDKDFTAESLAKRLPVKTREKHDELLSEELLITARAADQIDLDEAQDALMELALSFRGESSGKLDDPGA